MVIVASLTSLVLSLRSFIASLKIVVDHIAKRLQKQIKFNWQFCCESLLFIHKFIIKSIRGCVEELSGDSIFTRLTIQCWISISEIS